jgi:phosphohistidine phosphatase SixA
MAPCSLLGIAAFLVAVATPSGLRAQASTIILVRHAEKAAPSADPDLSPAGRARSQTLATALLRFPLRAVVVSEYRRTRQTAEPTAAAHRLAPLVVPVGDDPKAHAAAVADVVRQLPMGSAALIVGHSNTLAPIIAALGGPGVGDLCDTEYATLYLLELPGDVQAPRLLRASFGAADPTGAADCPQRSQLD